MRNYFIVIIALFLFACQAETNEMTPQEVSNGTFVGASFDLEEIIPASEILVLLTEEESEVVRVEGTVVEVCQSKGCWMTFDTTTDKNMRITFLDYGFFVPKDIAGQNVVLEGRGWVQKTDVNTLRHYAEDAGKPAEEIAAITEERIEYLFEASGVYIREAE
jgi:hypothetical protein